MADVKFRQIDFQFNADIPFHFNPRNIGVSNFVNAAAFVAPAFERYFIKVIRDAMPQLSAPLRQEADVFCRQEAQHAKHHLAHQALLLGKYPQLEDTRKKVQACYTKLLEEEPVEFHLAYTASVELFFGPTTRFFVEQRERLFGAGDRRIAAFMLWHFVEEFEHRNCAIDVYNALVGSHTYRVRNFWPTLRHLRGVFELTAEGLEACVPSAQPGLPGMTAGLMAGAPKASLARLLFSLACTLLPYHNPDRLREPEWMTRWFTDEAVGKDMRLVDL